MTARPSRVLVTNCVLLNTGDAAILMGLVDRVRAVLGDDIELTVVDSQSDAARRHYPDLTIRPMLQAAFPPAPARRGLGRLVRAVRRRRVLLGARCMAGPCRALSRMFLTGAERSALVTYLEADVVVSTGGTYLVERYPLADRVLEFDVALAMGKPLILFTQSLGPFAQPRNRRAMRRVGRRARLILLRDEQSRAHLADVGVTGDHVHVVGDAAFGLEAPRRRVSNGRLRVIVSVRDWPYAAGDSDAINDAYRDALASLVERLVTSRAAEVTFMSTCQGVPEYWTDDSAVAVDIARRLPPHVGRSVHVDRTFHTPSDLLERLVEYDLVVATRMHMAILALVAGVPVFALAYEFKTRELCDRVGLGAWVRDLENVDRHQLPDAVDGFLAALPGIEGTVRSNVEAERRSAHGTSDLMTHALERADASRE
jgi:colanic acid/amylovoran biosynthesis protein